MPQHAFGLLGGLGRAGTIGSGMFGQQNAAIEMDRIQRDALRGASIFNGTFINCTSTGALRDGTGKIVTHPETFIEELQAETNEWLGDTWD